jgi:hypothetical protein
MRLFVGYGPETLHWAFQAVFPLELRQVTSEIWTWDRAHNIFLDQLVDTGLLGLTALLWVVWLAARTILVRLRQAEEPQWWLLIGVGGAIAGHLVDGFFGLDTPVTLLLFWAYAGLLAAPRATETLPVVSVAPRAVQASAAFWATLLVIGLGVTLASGLAQHPVAMAGIWGIAAVSSAAAAAGTLAGSSSRIDAERQSRPRVPIVTVVGLVVLLALGSQVWQEAAAMSERLGLAQLDQGKTADAIQSLQVASRAAGYEPQYQTELAGAFLTLAASRPAPTGPETFYPGVEPRGVDPATLQQLGRTQLLQLSEASLVSAQNLSPLDPDTYGNLGNLYLEWNQVARGVEEYTHAEQLSPDNPRYIAQQALAELQAGHGTTARRRAQDALQLDTTFWLSHYAMAITDSRLGATGGAKREATLALYWMKNYWPQPPSSEVQQLRSLQKTG